jgi:hypothetical protein
MRHAHGPFGSPAAHEDGTHARRLAVDPDAPAGEPCAVCCPWQFPLIVHPRPIAGGYVPLRYHEWLVYHLHIITHQGLDRVQAIA